MQLADLTQTWSLSRAGHHSSLRVFVLYAKLESKIRLRVRFVILPCWTYDTYLLRYTGQTTAASRTMGGLDRKEYLASICYLLY